MNDQATGRRGRIVECTQGLGAWEHCQDDRGSRPIRAREVVRVLYGALLVVILENLATPSSLLDNGFARVSHRERRRMCYQK